MNLSSSALERFLQARGYRRGHQSGQIPSEHCQLLDAAGAEEAELWGRHQVRALDVGGHLAIELVHLELVLEVGDRAQALDDRLGTVLAGELDEQVVERLDLHVAQHGDLSLDELDSLLCGE